MRICCLFMSAIPLLLIPSQEKRDGEPRRSPFSPSEFQKAAEKFVDAINRDDQVMIHALTSKSIHESVSPLKLKQTRDWYIEQRGLIESVGNAVILSNCGRFDLVAERGGWTMELILTPDGLISGFIFEDPPPRIEIPERNITRLRLPFRGEWSVNWGGMKPEHNYHLNQSVDEKHAVDFGKRDAKGLDYRNGGKTNDDYYAYGQDILAVGEGEIVMAVDGVPDNLPGLINTYSATGNTIIIKHAKFEYSVYAHLRLNSIRVKLRDRVTSGQVIALCGNSGVSNAPHLHFHMMNTDVISQASGFPLVFSGVSLRRGDVNTMQESYSPVKDDFVSALSSGRK
jgi:hypothetical protein